MVCKCSHRALSSVQNPDISASDTSGVTEGDLFFFSYSPSFPERYEFWDINPLVSTKIL